VSFLFGYDVVSLGNWFQKFRDNKTVSPSRIETPKSPFKYLNPSNENVKTRRNVGNKLTRDAASHFRRKGISSLQFCSILYRKLTTGSIYLFIY
jgi:hypothetical protein